jgi:hypothetical protein
LTYHSVITREMITQPSYGSYSQQFAGDLVCFVL